MRKRLSSCDREAAMGCTGVVAVILMVALFVIVALVNICLP